MKIFHCDNCGSLVFFENDTCLNCGLTLGFLPPMGKLGAIEKTKQGAWRPLTPDLADQQFRYCENSEKYQVCNWMIPIDDPARTCVACRLNEVIPNLSLPENVDRWHKLENAKRRVLYTINKLGLPIGGVSSERRPGLKFKFIGNIAGQSAPLTGHLNGTITVNIVEADDVERERRRVSLQEPYRTLLGHLRHETAHYFWDRLVADSQWLPRFRQIFGDEQYNYDFALKSYYAQGARPEWSARFVSAYATSHPWEDWAETWAHYFHIIDMMETAESFGLSLKPNQPAAKSMTAEPGHAGDHFEIMLRNWFPLTHALNSLNRGMGLHDIYPFVLSNPVIEKMRFIHEVIHASSSSSYLN